MVFGTLPEALFLDKQRESNEFEHEYRSWGPSPLHFSLMAPLTGLGCVVAAAFRGAAAWSPTITIAVARITPTARKAA